MNCFLFSSTVIHCLNHFPNMVLLLSTIKYIISISDTNYYIFYSWMLLNKATVIKYTPTNIHTIKHMRIHMHRHTCTHYVHTHANVHSTYTATAHNTHWCICKHALYKNNKYIHTFHAFFPSTREILLLFSTCNSSKDLIEFETCINESIHILDNWFLGAIMRYSQANSLFLNIRSILLHISWTHQKDYWRAHINFNIIWTFYILLLHNISIWVELLCIKEMSVNTISAQAKTW